MFIPAPPTSSPPPSPTPGSSPTSNPLSTSSTEIPTQLIQINPKITASTDAIPCSYNWNYDGKEWNLEMNAPLVLYDYYREIPRLPTRNYSVYITHPSDDVYLSGLVAELKRTASGKGFDDLETVGFVTAFVQSLPYSTDSVSTAYDEYPRYPIETLVDNGGDCEDTSILTASLLHNLGYEVSLILFPDEHCAVGVADIEGLQGAYFRHNGEDYYYLETTNTDWKVGQMPEELNGIETYIYDMTPVPILTHEWNGKTRGNIAELEITVENMGTQVAEDVHIVAGFDAGEGKLWNVEESDIFDLPANHIIVITIRLNMPSEKHTRIVIQIIDDGYAVSESYSEWFE